MQKFDIDYARQNLKERLAAGSPDLGDHFDEIFRAAWDGHGPDPAAVEAAFDVYERIYNLGWDRGYFSRKGRRV